MCIKSILLISLLLSICLADDAVLSLPGSNKKATKEELGTMGTLVNIYLSIRSGCSMVYQELQYWQGINEDYQNIKKWFNHNKKLVSSIGDQTINLFTDFEVSFNNMEKMEVLFDDIDNLFLNETRKFDALVTGMENDWDSLARDEHTFSYGDYEKTIKCVPGMIIPNVDQTLKFYEQYLPTEKIRKNYFINKAADTSQIAEKQYNYFIDTTWPEQKIKLVSEMIMATTQAKSISFNKWSSVARYNLDKNIDSIFKATKNVNENDFAASYYALLEANDENKRVHHSLEEAKVLCQMLGIDVFSNAKKVMEEKETVRQFIEAKNILRIERKQF